MATIQEHLEKLKHLDAVIRCGSMRKAARSLRLSQPALSRSIHHLELILGYPLLNRTPGGAKASVEGLAWWEFHQEVVRQSALTECRILALQQQLKAAIRIGTYESIAIYFWPRVLKKLASEYPFLNISLETASSPKILSRLLRGKLDLCMTVNTSGHPKVHSARMFEDHFYFFAKPGLRSSPGKGSVLIYSSHALKTAHLHVKAVISSHPHLQLINCGTLEVVLALASQGIGIGLLPTCVAREAVLGGRLERSMQLPFALKGPIDSHSISISCLHDNRHNPAIRAVIQAASEVQAETELQLCSTE